MTIAVAILISAVSYAQPYGSGTYNSILPYGSQTSLSIATDGNVDIVINPNEDAIISTGKSIVTVTSTDVAGYKLYINALYNTSMNNNGSLINASSNENYAPLAVNTWGYNTDGSDEFLGIKLNHSLIRSSNYLTIDGETTEITYGIKIDMQSPAGNYIADIVYTAVPQTY